MKCIIRKRSTIYIYICIPNIVPRNSYIYIFIYLYFHIYNLRYVYIYTFAFNTSHHALTTLGRRISFTFLFHVNPFFFITLKAMVKISLANKIYPSCAFLRVWETMAKVRKNLKAKIHETEKWINDVGVRDTPYITIAGCEAYSTCNSYITGILLFTRFANDESTFEHP